MILLCNITTKSQGIVSQIITISLFDVLNFLGKI